MTAVSVWRALAEKCTGDQCRCHILVDQLCYLCQQSHTNPRKSSYLYNSMNSSDPYCSHPTLVAIMSGSTKPNEFLNIFITKKLKLSSSSQNALIGQPPANVWLDQACAPQTTYDPASKTRGQPDCHWFSVSDYLLFPISTMCGGREVRFRTCDRDRFESHLRLLCTNANSACHPSAVG